MKLIFLDFDEVMNSILYRKTSRKKLLKEAIGEAKSKYSMEGKPADAESLNFFIKKKSVEVDPIAMNLLSHLVNETKAKVIICSTWRNQYPFRLDCEEEDSKVVERFKMLFDTLGYPSFPVIGVTGYKGFRGLEVAECLDEIAKTEEIEEYLIIDDGADFFTDDMTKMNDEEISKCALIHNRPGQPVFNSVKDFEGKNPQFWSQQPLLCTSHLTGLTSTDVFDGIAYLNRKDPENAYVMLDKSYEPYKHRYKLHNKDVYQDTKNDNIPEIKKITLK